MRHVEDIADYVKRNRYGNFMREQVVAEKFIPIENILEPKESVYSAFVGTIYSIPKHFVALTNQRLLILSYEKKNPRIYEYPLEDIVRIYVNDMGKGIIRIESTLEVKEVRAEPCYSKRIAIELSDTLYRLKQKKRAD